MESSFAWLDYSDAQRRQMVGIIDQFRDKTTVDELGFGSIRNTFADRFFPVTTWPPLSTATQSALDAHDTSTSVEPGSALMGQSRLGPRRRDPW
jgi:Family of unknown function (DUF6361)